MRIIALRDFLSEHTNKPPGTVAARIAELQTADLAVKGERGRYGGADLAESDLTSAFLSLIMDFPRGADVGAEVRRVRSMPIQTVATPSLHHTSSLREHMKASAKFLRPLTIMSTLTFGDALDSLLRDFRAGAYAKWAREASQLAFELQNNGAMASITLDRGAELRNSVLLIYESDPSWRRDMVQRCTRVHHAFFWEAAHALGPLTTPT
jgi:hypothetical protein